MKTKRCPACKSDVPAEAADCPQCPHSFEVFQGAHSKSRKFGIAAWTPAVWAAVVAGLMYGVWRFVEFVIEQADPDEQHSLVQSFIDKQRITVRDKHGREQVVSDGTAQEQRSVQVEGAVAAPPGSVNEWRLVGVVYDLVTLKPVPRCLVHFTDPDTHARYETSSDDSGAYRTIVPPLHHGGYQVGFEKAGYADSYLNPETQNVAGMPDEDRKTTAAELAKTAVAPYEIQPRGAAPLQIDFYLAPAAD